MSKIKSLFLFIMLSMTLTSCGNDEEVEAKFVEQVNKAIQQLTESKSVDDVIKANDLLNLAYEIDGAQELKKTGKVEQVLKQFDEELDKAEQNVLNNLHEDYVNSTEMIDDSED